MFASDLLANGPRRFSVETIFVFAELYLIWLVALLFRSFVRRAIRVVEYVLVFVFSWFVWINLGYFTHNQVTHLLGEPRPLDDSTYGLIFVIYIPLLLLQYVILIVMRGALRLDYSEPQ